VIVMVVTAARTAVGIAVAAAATDQNDDDDKPQAGTVVITVVKAHDCHLTLRHSMRRILWRSLAFRKIRKEK
jgi:hypothetical protein